MNNEPVAWMHKFLCDFSPKQSEHFNIPLYTHPVKEQSKIFNEKGQELILGGDGTRLYKNPPVKELTDEEIKEAMEFAGIRPSKEWGLATTGNVQLQIFAKAILRKAQEK